MEMVFVGWIVMKVTEMVHRDGVFRVAIIVMEMVGITINEK